MGEQALRRLADERAVVDAVGGRQEQQIARLSHANRQLLEANDEVETLNEELQATNEEQETLNEELQATVEELNTTNDDLQARSVELQELTAELEAEREQLRSVLSSMSDAVLVLDKNGTPVLTNEV